MNSLKPSLERIKPYLGRLVCTILGLAVAILFLTLGFFKTVIILVCCGMGYVVGIYKDKGVFLFERLMFWRDKS